MNSSTEKSDIEQSKNQLKVDKNQRRDALQKVLMAGGIVGVAGSLPNNWVKPVVDSVFLPSHAQTSSRLLGGMGGAPIVKSKGVSNPFDLLNEIIPTANAQASLISGGCMTIDFSSFPLFRFVFLQTDLTTVTGTGSIDGRILSGANASGSLRVSADIVGSGSPESIIFSVGFNIIVSSGGAQQIIGMRLNDTNCNLITASTTAAPTTSGSTTATTTVTTTTPTTTSATTTGLTTVISTIIGII